MSFKNKYSLGKNAKKRLGEIFSILRKHGFISWTSILFFGKKLFKKKINSIQAEEKHKIYKEARLSIEELGPTFIKLGQLLSVRRDLIPEDFVLELEKLQDEVFPMDYPTIKKIIEEDFGKKIEDIFIDFQEKPLASASISQVHIAKLKSGEKVAVKTMREDIKKIIPQDLEILYYLAGMLSKFQDFKRFNLHDIVREFEMQINFEMSFFQEKNNIKRFFEIKNRNFKVPKVFEEYSTPRVLTMEFIDGLRIKNFKEEVLDKKIREKVSYEIANSIFKQLLEYRLLHSDPHPGNIFVVDQDKICFIDYGMVKYISLEQERMLEKMFLGFLEYNSKPIVEFIMDVCSAPYEYHKNISQEIDFLMTKYAYTSLKDLSIAEVYRDLINVVNMFSLSMPSGYFYIIRSLTLVEGICRELSPEFNIFEMLNKMMESELKKEYIKNFSNNLQKSIEENYYSLQNFPSEIKKISKIFKNGRINVNLEIKGLNEVSNNIDRVGTSFLFGIVLGSILLSSSIILRNFYSSFGGKIYILGLIGFAIAGMMAFGFLFHLVWRILSHKKEK